MPKFRVISDLHLEDSYKLEEIFTRSHPHPGVTNRHAEILPVMPDDHNTYLLLAGDTHTKLRDSKYAEKLWGDRFKHIYMVHGNHSYWGESIRESVPNTENVTVLEKDVVDIEGVRLAGCTLWTDMNNDPLDIINGGHYMNDYRNIREYKTEGRPLKPETTVRIAKESYKWLKTLDNIDIIMTHHGLTYQGVPQKYKNNDSNFCYYNHYDDVLDELKPKYYIFGHSHECMDFTHSNGVTRCINNSYGYSHEEKNYVKELVLEC